MQCHNTSGDFLIVANFTTTIVLHFDILSASLNYSTMPYHHFHPASPETIALFTPNHHLPAAL
jgi:hypothetical protein